MSPFRAAILQAAAITAVATAVGFAFNAFSRHGIDPFKRPADIAVVPDAAGAIEGVIRVIGLEGAKQAVARGITVIDARRKEAYEAGHIPGALLLDYYDMATYRDAVLPYLSQARPFMVYCSEPACDDSELLAKELYLLGYEQVLVFKGGFAEWSAAGLAVRKGAK
jgi:rhodanese-related sulfurtransferase